MEFYKFREAAGRECRSLQVDALLYLLLYFSARLCWAAPQPLGISLVGAGRCGVWGVGKVRAPRRRWVRSFADNGEGRRGCGNGEGSGESSQLPRVGGLANPPHSVETMGTGGRCPLGIAGSGARAERR